METTLSNSVELSTKSYECKLDSEELEVTTWDDGDVTLRMDSYAVVLTPDQRQEFIEQLQGADLTEG